MARSGIEGPLTLQKKTRISKPKVKTGCITCKIRRVKCDETKNQCLRCVQSGFKCDGYEVKKPPPNRLSHQRIAPNFQPILYQPRTSRLSQDEYRYFRMFSDELARQLSGQFNPAVWNRLIPQASESQPSIRHAVVAIAALKKTSELLFMPNSPRIGIGGLEEAKAHHEFALRQYSRALQSMRDTVDSGKQELRITLMTCMVIACFENFHGNHAAAGQQVVIGLGLIEDHLLDPTPEAILAGADAVEDDLVQCFRSLDIEAMAFIDPRTPEQHRVLKSLGQSKIDDMPGEFESLTDAKIHLDVMMQRTMHLMASALPHQIGCLTLDISKCIPDEYLTEFEFHLAGMRRWHNAFSPLFRRLCQIADPKLHSSVMTLEIIYQTSYVAAVIIRTSSQPYPETRKFMSNFQIIISLAKSILKHPEVEKRTFAFEMQVICPLYTVAWRCPQRTLRREAISLLLSWPRREGFWDSCLAGKLAEWIMLMEEERFDGEYAPEDVRCSSVDILGVSMENRSAHVQCSLPQDGGWVLKETVLRW